MCLISNSLLHGVLLLCLLVSTSHAAPREKVNLDGEWNFATDPDNRGEAEKWYQPDTKLPQMPLPGYAPEAAGKIRVPGIWDNQGYGTETDKVRHNFVGKGWYKRQVEIPQSWAGRRAFLMITGVSRYARVWIDDHFLGEHIGFLSVQEYDLTPYLAPGQTITLTIQVDSQQRWEIDALYGACTLADFMDIPWGGIWGHVLLEARSDVWLSELFVQPDLSDSTCSASAVLNGKAGSADTAKLEVFDAGGQCVADALFNLEPQIAAGQTITLQAAIPDAKLWTPDTPTLYTARLSLLKNNQVLDTIETRFGMRQFSIDGPYLLLNGQRLMLCGYGDDHIYPEQMAMPSDKELHLARLRTIKSYGFNHVRHHSSIMPPEYYQACDELGMIATAEFPICYHIYLPGVGTTWQQSVPAGTDPTPAIETYGREWTAVIKQYRNHPSILCWVMGNELTQYDSLAKPTALFAGIARQLDPRRFFIDSDGVAESILHDPKTDRPTLDFYTIQFNEGSNPLDNPAKFHFPRPIKPAISHEAGNYVTFSRPDLADQFQHNIKPFWLTEGLAKLEKLELLQEANQWAEKSERLYLLLHKYNLETLRKNPFLSGYHWWLFQDYWTSSNGIVDHYFRPKSIAKEEVLKINNEVVLLESGLEHTYRGKARLDAKLLLSNYSTQPLQGEFIWEVKAGDKTVSKQQMPLNPVPQGEVVEMTYVDVELPEVTSPTQLNITTEVVANGKHYANDWSSWLYPAVIHPTELSIPVFADEIYAKQFPDWNIQSIPSKGDLSDRAAYLMSWPCDPRIVDAMKRGASVVILDGAEQLLKSYPITFRTSWWKAGDAPETNHTGTFVYDHPVTRSMTPDGWCDDGWFFLIEGARKFVLETMPTRPNIIIRALPSMVRVEDQALLFEVSVGEGSLLVSGLNHRHAVGRPENEWLIACLLDHAAQFPQPKATWPASFLAVVSVAPEGSLPGFRRLVANEGEDGTWYSFREDNARVLICRQTKPGNRVTWETAPVPKEPANERVTFVFAGGLGFSSEPKTEGFVLEINGKETLRFDLPEPTTWQSADKRVELRFDSSRTIAVDQFGLFHLTVPLDMLESGVSCRLSVRSLGTGSQRWFGLNPY
jgi:hypothetical protein